MARLAASETAAVKPLQVVSRFKLAQGPAGIRQTLKKIAALVIAGSMSPVIRAQAESLVRALPQKDYLSEARAVHAFVRDQVRYTRDPRSLEMLDTAERVLRDRIGDCDAKTVLGAALLEALGHPTQLVAIGPRRNVFTHVYFEVLINGQWVGVETTEPWPLGKVAAGFPGRMVQKVKA